MILQRKTILSKLSSFTNSIKDFSVGSNSVFFVKTIQRINTKTWMYLLFILIHLFLFNINVAEWGDSYRILRASEYIKSDGIYPTDEKRPPLYSLLLSLRPIHLDQIFWGRLFMFIVSILYFYIFDKFISLFIKNEKYKNVALLLFIFNPVLLYWSIRLYADVFFSAVVLFTIYLFVLWSRNQGLLFKSNKLDYKHSIILGILCGISVLTRFEGYLLFGSIGISLFIYLFLEPKNNIFSYIVDLLHIKKLVIVLRNKHTLQSLMTFVLSFFLTVLPWYIYRNPISGSSYLEEPANRSYDLKMVSIYVVSLLFIFGFTSAFYFIKRNYKGITTLLSENLILLVFMSFDLILILLWPAAIPRLFVPIIPFLILLLSLSIEKFFEEFKNSDTSKLHIIDLYYLIPLALLYVVSQYFLKLQFLVPTRILFILLFLIQLTNIFSISTRNFKLFLYTLFISITLWSFAVIWIHKDTFISVKNAAEYVSKEISGVVAFNDVSSVSDWYLNQKDRSLNKYNLEYNDTVFGYFYNFEKNDLLTYESLLSKGMDYLLITNEHNTTMDINLEKRPYLTLIKEFSYNVNGKTFSTRVVKLNKEYIK